MSSVSMKFAFNWTAAEKKSATMRARAITATHDFLNTEVYKPSQALVPVDTGDLKRSGKINPAEITPNGFNMSVTYGSDVIDYAIFVHDGTVHMSARKFLEIPALAAASKYGSAIAKVAA